MTLISPVITEKSMRAASVGIYTFNVLLGSTKSQIKQAIEVAFKVKVVAISVLRRHVPGRGTGPKRLMGNSSQLKHATVKLAKGQSIDLFDLKDDK